MFKFFSKLFKKQPKSVVKCSSKGIYHVPGGKLYEAVNPTEVFATEEEAVAAGYRKSKI